MTPEDYTTAIHALQNDVLNNGIRSMTDGQFDALASFVFNLSGGALQRSTLRREINREEHGAVPAEFMKWAYACGRKLKGLVRPQEAEAGVYAA